MSRRALPIILVTILSLALALPVAADDGTTAATGFTITIDRVGWVDSEGRAIVTGTVLCGPEDLEGLTNGDVRVVQKVGRLIADGYGYASELICDGTVHTWIGFAESSLVDDHGRFIYKPGPASASIFTHEGERPVERSVRLRPLGG